MVFQVGMRIRFTQNVDKDRGFVNGALGTIHEVLRKDVFVLKTDKNVLILVHPVRQYTHESDKQGQQFMPCSYGYAMTTRRAAGAILEAVAL